MSTLYELGIVTKTPLEEKRVGNLVKVLFDFCDDIGFTKVRPVFSHNKLDDLESDFEFEFKNPPTITELSELIKKFTSIKGMIHFPIIIDSKSGGFDADIAVINKREIVDVSILIDDYVLKSPENVKKLLEMCESIYNSIDAFYTYISTDYDTEATEGVENTAKFKNIFKKYKEMGKTPFDMKSFREKLRALYL